MRLATLGLSLAITLALPFSAHAGVDWTSCGACGTIDNGSQSYYAYSNDGVTFNSSSVYSIEARYNVVDVAGSNSPGWGTLEIGYDTANGTGDSISATLWSVVPSTNNETSICTATSSASSRTSTCTFTGLDFSTKIYYVWVTISRSTFQEYPTLDTLRIY
jgi:hypothetical protein